MAISVFLSYSRKDEAVVRQLASDLERGRVTVWRDAELRGGDPWWQKILEQIRACDVFVLALSNNGLASKPCRAEFTYARDLGLPVLPVQIGPVDSLRTAAVGEMQVVEYQERTGATGIALFAELEEAARRRGPLPDPLPPAPSVPFAYLLRLGSEIEKEALTPAEQGKLIGELRSCLETEDDEGVKDDARELLRALRRRPDVTFRYAGEVDALLVGVPAQRTSDQPTVPQPPQPSQQGPSGGASARPASAESGATAASVQTPVQAPVQAHPAGASPSPGSHGYGVPPPRYGAPPPPVTPGYPPTDYHPGPAAPTRRGGSRLPLLLLLGAFLVVILVVGGVLVFNRNDAGPGPGPTTGPRPTTSSSPPSTAPPSSTAPATSPVDQLGDAARRRGPEFVRRPGPAGHRQPGRTRLSVRRSLSPARSPRGSTWSSPAPPTRPS